MNSDTLLDYAQFQLSPRRSHCELFVCGDGITEKIASGLLKPFVAHLKVAEEQYSKGAQSIKLKSERPKKARMWFNKGTLERFVRFVSTPEVLETVHTFDAEMSQLEGAKGIYSQGVDDQLSCQSGECERVASKSEDITKRELLRAIGVRLGALKQELTMAFARASAAGFTLDTISQLLCFADNFGAHRLSEACQKFSLLCQRHPDIATQHQHHHREHICKGMAIAPPESNIRSSSDSDMSLDGPDNASKPLIATVASIINKAPNCILSNSLQGQPKTVNVSLAKEADGSGKSEQVVASAPSSSTQPSGGARRLSVQDRINLFESKQKEQTSSSSALAGSAGASTVGRSGGRPELRRLSSDVSTSVEKSVLRRWSGAGDMSIDFGCRNMNHIKKEGESNMSNPSDSSCTYFDSSSIKSLSKNDDNDNSTSQSLVSLEEASPSMQKPKSISKSDDKIEDAMSKSGTDLEMPSTFMLGKNQGTQLNKENGHGIGQMIPDCQYSSSPVAFNNTRLDEQGTSITRNLMASHRLKPVGSVEARSDASTQVILKGKEDKQTLQPSQLLNAENSTGSEEPVTVSPNLSAPYSEVKDLNALDSLSKLQKSRSKEKTKSSRKNPISSDGLPKNSKAEIAPSKGDHLASQVTLPPKPDEISSRSGSSAPAVQLDNSRYKGTKEIKVTSSSHQDTNMQKMSFPDSTKVFRRDKDVSLASFHSISLQDPLKKNELTNNSNSLQSSTKPVQIVEPAKGNQELNSDLQMKADELEKLFAEHLLRIPGDLPSTKIGKSVNYPKCNEKWLDPEEDSLILPPEKSTGNLQYGTQFNADKLIDIVNSHDCYLGSKYEDLSLSMDLRGKFYDKYAQKRDLKLMEEWGSRRASKEATLKAMRDKLEQSRAEMKTKFSGSAERQNSAMHIQQRAEKLRSFSSYSTTIIREQQPGKFLHRVGEYLEDSQQISCTQNQFACEIQVDGYIKNTIEKNSSSQNTSYTPPSFNIPINTAMNPPSFSQHGRRRIAPENSLAQSVPNFSNLRKESTKLLSGTCKMATRVHSRSIIRSEGNSIGVAKHEKSFRSQSMPKDSASPIELSDLSSVNSDNMTVELTDQNLYQKGAESKSFLRKGKGIGPGFGATVGKDRSSKISRNIEKEDDFDGSGGDVNIAKEGGLLTLSAEVTSRLVNGASRTSADSDLELKNGEVSELLDGFSSSFAVVSSGLKSPTEDMQQSAEGSPGSWNSRAHHSSSYVQETSDIDASIDSPIGSPASWKSHALSQMVDSDTARMRKKWGAAQKPMFLNNSSNPPKKDVTRGFKRLLKFGRKNKGQDALLPDWVSASTNSEGDEDPEDFRDSGNHLMDDKPKSRMGFSQHQSAYDDFTDGGFFHDEAAVSCFAGHSHGSSIPLPPPNFKLREDHLSGSSLKAPRSFFSLSTFRSKGGEPKLR